MRKSLHTLIVISIIFLSTTSFTYAQSGWLPSQTGYNNNYYSIHFTNNLTGWVCGSSGRVLKTVNGGLTWTAQNSAANVNLRSIKFVSADIGCACGDNGVIVRTLNSGIYWVAKTSGTASNLNSMFFVNSSTGWIAGDSGVILKTTNSGDNWFRQQTPITVSLKSVHFTSANTGWAVGSSGKILKTTNSGSSWLAAIDLGSITTLYAVHFTDAMNGYISGEYITSQGKFVFFYKTVTGGEWWLYQFAGVNTSMKSIYFSNPLKGWAAGDSGVILGTINGGINWIGQPSHTTNNLNTVYFTSPVYGWITGNSGTVLKTINGGFFDTLNTNRRDLGVIPLVTNSSSVPDAKYRIMFRAPDTSYNILRSLNNGISFDTIISHVPLSDTGKAFDGLLLRVKKIKFDPAGGLYNGNAGVVKDPVNSPDTIQTRMYGWGYNPPQNRNLEGGRFIISGGTFRPWQSISMSLSYPTRSTFTGFRSLLNPEDLRKVKIVFTGYGNGSMAYRYKPVSVINYAYQDMRVVPFKVYEIEQYDGSPNPRQLNIALLEADTSNADGKWEPTTDSTGGKDILYIFASDYDPNPNTFYTAKNLFLQLPQIDVMYAWNAKLIQNGAAFQLNDELLIYPYTVTRPELVVGYPLFYEFQTYSLIGIKKISNTIPAGFMLQQNYPNPFNPKTKIKFSIPKVRNNGITDVSIMVYDILGREVSVLVKETLLPGEYETEFDGTNFSSGVYFYMLRAGDYSETKKMVLLK
jgi:photosystem II stability/assembly factor-like uncharacterized protein